MRKRFNNHITFKEIVNQRIDQLECAFISNFNQELLECPLQHEFEDGKYIRSIFIQAGKYIIGKIHKQEHPFVVHFGKILVSANGGKKWELIEAPYKGTTTPNTRRIGYALEDTVWSDYHDNIDNTKDLKLIEDRVIIKRENKLLSNLNLIN